MNARATVLRATALLVAAFAGLLHAQAVAPDLKALEDHADAEYSRRDWVAAEKAYAQALELALASGETTRASLYYVRMGNCRTRVGDFSVALEDYQHTISLAESSGDDEQLAVGIHGAALQLMKLARIDEALPLGRKEYELAQKCGHPTHLVRAMWLLAAQYQVIGRVRDGLEMLNRALAISRGTKETAVTAVILDGLATIYLGLGDLETAAYLEKQILAMPEKDVASTVTTYSPAITHNNLGEIQLRAGQKLEARRSFESALETSTDPADWRVHLTALLNLADMHNAEGRLAQSDSDFRMALELADSVKFPDLQSAVHQVRSDALLTRGNIKGAVDDSAEALRVARQLAAPDRVYKALLSVGAANAAAGQQSAARVNFDEALEIAETLRAQSPGEVSDLRGAFAALIPLYQASVKNLIDLHSPAEALQRAEQAKARVLMDILLRGGVDERAVMTQSEAAGQESLRKRLAAANAAASGMPSGATTHALQQAMVEFRQARRDLYGKHPELVVQSADFEPAGLEQLAPLISAPGTALLDYFFVPSGVALFVIRQPALGATLPELKVYLLPDPKHDLAAEARSFRQQLANRELGYRAAAQHLFNRLLAPAMTSLRGTTEWVVSPDGALWDIPFGALIDRAGHHVIESRAVALTPSFTASLEMRKRSRTAARIGDTRLLAFGNPLPSSSSLPDAAREVTEISANYPRGSTVILTGTAATAAAFRKQSPSARIIHLAAHAGLNNSDPLSSWVRLAGTKDAGDDGTLTALDIMSLHLGADLVVLSACETALGATGPGEGMIGMGWALSAAGASSSVLSFWKVDSAASREFMTSFYRNLGVVDGSTSKSAALRNAELRMLQSPEYRHPFYWAAFALWGDAR